MRARVNEQCDGTGLCEKLCPEVFSLGGDGKASIVTEEVPSDAQSACLDAQQQCPRQAIEIEE
jgi:ferredoxin